VVDAEADRTKQLQHRFGPEYDRTTRAAKSKREAESELGARQARREQLDIRPLSASARERYTVRWQTVQAQFVDNPDGSVASAAQLIQAVMEDRGYPVEQFESRASDISVDHPEVVQNYRQGHRLARQTANGKGSTEDLRQALRNRRPAPAVVMVSTAVRISTIILALAAVCAALVTVGSSAASLPYLVSTAASRGHVVAVFTLGGSEADFAPGRITVAVRPQTQTNGSFVPANVRVEEPLSNLKQVPQGERVRTQHRLRPGRYYVKVSGTQIGLDCTPKNPCKELWSNARRVVIPRP
jgi:hypothetical protein